jgi:hypothetical protein
MLLCHHHQRLNLLLLLVLLIHSLEPSTVTAAVTFSAGTLLYQWQRQTATGTRWTNVTDAGVFSGATH